MTTQNQSKATAFDVLFEHCNEAHPHMESPRGQIDLRKAKEEHAALCAVAEAACAANLVMKKVAFYADLKDEIRSLMVEVGMPLGKALAALAAIRKEGGQ